MGGWGTQGWCEPRLQRDDVCACTEHSCPTSAGSRMIQGRALDFRKGGETRESTNEPQEGLATSLPSCFFLPWFIASGQRP